MKRKYFALLIFAIFLQTSFAQRVQLDLTQATTTLSPERHGYGIFEHIVRGDNLLTLGDTENAILAYDVAVAQDPYFAEAYLKRSIAKYRLGRKEEARQDYNQAVSLNPYVADLYGYKSGMSKLRVLAFDMEASPEDLFPEKLQLDTNVKNYLLAALKHKKAGNIHHAMQAMNTAIDEALTPEAVLFQLRGNLYVLLDDYGKAIADYNRAIQLNNNYEEAYFNRGLALILAMNRSDGCDDLERSVNMGYQAGERRTQYFCGL